jgi:hypothetical protein
MARRIDKREDSRRFNGIARIGTSLFCLGATPVLGDTTQCLNGAVYIPS